MQIILNYRNVVLIRMNAGASVAKIVYPPDLNVRTTSVELCSSPYLDGYSVEIEARWNGTIVVMMNVDGKGIMEKIGIREVSIDCKENGS